MKSTIVCEICGRAVDPTYSVIDSETLVTMCGDCYPYWGTCRTCEQAKDCLLMDDTSGIPKVISRQINQKLPNGMTAISVVNELNPSLVETICKVSCPCFSEEFGCLRQNIGFCKDFQPPRAVAEK